MRSMERGICPIAVKVYLTREHCEERTTLNASIRENGCGILCCFTLVCQCVDVLRVGGQCSDQCELLGGQRRCWGAASDMCQTCQFLHAAYFTDRYFYDVVEPDIVLLCGVRLAYLIYEVITKSLKANLTKLAIDFSRYA